MQTAFTPAQLADPDVAVSEKILRACVHCGFCTATCPTYVLLGDELDSPRGRIYLIKDMLENSRPARQPVVTHIDRCLSCLACMTTCPSGVHYQHLVDHARAHIERTYRRPWRERLVRAVLARILPHPGRLRVALALARAIGPLARLWPQRDSVGEGSLTASLRAMLRLAARAPATERSLAGGTQRAVTGAPPAHRGRVALISGCAQGVLAPEAQAATVRLLHRAGREVVPIAGCCGALVHHLGKVEQGRMFGARILAQIESEHRRGGLDAVIVTASGCGTHLKDYAHLFRNDAARAAAAAHASALTRDVTEWLESIGWSTPPCEGDHAGLPIAYHSACSMQHGQRLDRIPERLLERAGFDVREIPEGHLCCGSAGTYNILQPRIAAQLRERKLENIRRTCAQVVATGNVGCIVQLAGAAGLPLVHTAELLDWAQGGPMPASLRARNG
ncbi:MAG TPA: glycolate oxidase subunit GlcF [Steroidobacteraceae bacterium]|nr:glycolate oxidase subunit GlcF [Steroidobacteraceae bacterium]